MTSSPSNSPQPAAGQPASGHPEVRRIQVRLGRLRTRIHAILATIGIGRWLVTAVCVFALFFLADYLLDLPLAVRQFVRLGLLHPPASLTTVLWLPLLAISLVLLVALTRRGHPAAPFFAFVVGGIAGLLAWMALRALVPERLHLSDDDLALSVENRFEGLHDRLAGALDFERELRNPTRGESPAMMEAVLQEAAQAARNLRFSQAVSARRALRWAGLAAGAMLCALLVGVAFSETVGLWARRSMLLHDEAWPRATHMFAVDLQADGSFLDHPPAEAYDVSIGRSFTIYARAQGKAPQAAQVLDLMDGQEPLSRRMFRVPGHEDVFAYEFLDVRRPFSFLLRGGDDDDEIPRYRVNITIPPRLLSIRSEITFPEYLHREETRVEDGSVTVPEGAQVRVTFTTDMEIAQAEAVLGDRTLPCAPADDGPNTVFSFSYTATRSAQGRIVMRTPTGKANDPAADSFEVRVTTDRPPRVEWIYPRAGVKITPDGRVPLLLRATDDHGVASLVLVMRVGTEKKEHRFDLEPFRSDQARSQGLVPLAVTDGPYGRRRILAYLPLEVRNLKQENGEPLLASSEVSFRIEARDFHDQVRQGELARVDIDSKASLENSLARRRRNVRESLKTVYGQQLSRRADIASLLDAPLGRPELDLLKTVRFAQGRIAQDSDRAVQELISVFNGFVYRRLGAPVPNDKILAFLDRQHRTTYGLKPAASAEPTLQRAGRQGDWLGDPVFPYTVYREIVEAWRSKVIFDTGLLDKMCAALAEAVELGSRLAPAAHRAATEATAGEPEALRTLLAAQDEAIHSMKSLLEAMRGWKNLSDVTVKLRSIIKEQERVAAALAGEDDKDKDKSSEKPKKSNAREER